MSIFFLLLIVGPFAAIATRLLLIARQTRRLPELLIGGFFLCVALMLPLRSLPSFYPEAARPWMVDAGNAFFCTAIVILFVFTWRVFRPTERWAMGLAGLGSTAVIGLYSMRMTLGEDHTTLLLSLSVVRLAPFVWAFVESTLYHRQMRRRAQLGLGDPIVANRFLLWAIWTGSVSFLPIYGLVVRVISQLFGDSTPWQANMSGSELSTSGVIVGSLFLLMSVSAMASMWLSFIPPAFYTRWIMKRTELSNG